MAKTRPHMPMAWRLQFQSGRASARTMVYASNGIDGTVTVIDAAANQVTATIPVGKRSWNMALTPDGSRLYVANGRFDSVSVIDTASNTRVNDIAVGALPWGVLIR